MTVVAPSRRKFPWLIYVIGLVIIVVALAPFVPVTLAAKIAGSHGCPIDEGSIHPCIIDGVDWGSRLYTLGTMGWLFLASFPIAGILLVVGLVVFGVHRNRFERERVRGK
jgi:hypothetical protein